MASKFLTVVIVLLLLFLVSCTISKTVDLDMSDKIAIIPITGIIMPSEITVGFYSKGTDPDTIINFIKKANQNKKVKGIILEINSPGGAVVASKEIAEAVEQSEKPIVALIKDIGTSGAYWVATSADSIVADELSLTGSIGVTASYIEVSKLFDEYGITYQPLKSGKYKDIGSPLKPLTTEEETILQKKLDKIHSIFIKEVAKNRNLPESTVKQLATGIYFLGEEAYNHKLIDHLGNKELAINITKNLANIEEAKLITFKKERTIFDLFSSTSINSFYSLGRGLGDSQKIEKTNLPSL